MDLLEGKVALITGAARGQGRAHAITCARAGADVIVVDIAAPAAAAVPYELATADDLAQTVRLVEGEDRRALACVADVRDQRALDEAVRRGIAEFEKIDIMIANAGIWTRNPFWMISDEQWDEMIGVNLTGVWKSVKAVTPHMIERRTGSIVITSSVNGLEPGRDFAHYVAAKHGLIGLMRTIALELGPHGVRCNSVNPGAIDTPMVDNQPTRDMFAGHSGATRAEMLEGGRHYPLLRNTSWLAPQAVADTVLYLNSPLAANVTGVSIPVDAGHLLIPGVNDQPALD